MAQDPKNIPRVINILWAARAIERIGDRCGNIAEYLFYLVHGRDVRHPRSRQRVAKGSSHPEDVPE
jgi:phosphate transport system protein